MKEYSCPLCSDLSCKIITDTFRGSDGSNSIVKCKKCGLIYLRPPKTISENKEYYDNDRQLRDISIKDFDFDEYIKKIGTDTRRRVEFVKKNINKNVSLLDVGCGYGYFVKCLSDEGYTAKGVDASRERIVVGKEKFDIDLVEEYIGGEEKDEVMDRNSYDVVTLFHFLEHTSEVDLVLSYLHEKLRKGGKIIIEVPAGSDYMLSNKEYGKFVYQESHSIYFKQKHLEIFLKRNGFKKIQTTHIQRYSLLNALNWMFKGTPQLVNPSRKVTGFVRFIDRVYRWIVCKLALSDTILITAHK